MELVFSGLLLLAIAFFGFIFGIIVGEKFREDFIVKEIGKNYKYRINKIFVINGSIDREVEKE